MSLIPGSRIGPYEVVARIGAGGMGEVYRARDTRLGRDVALKVLPDIYAADAERLARFEREAQALAALNHPHIAAIYGVEETEGGRALVLELVEGDTLDERIARGALPLEEALPLARQIAVALETAHEHGIVHRDLKPSNIKIGADGSAKVLDFGLAKLGEPAGAASSSAQGMVSQSPTITSPAMMTGIGLILGTAAYMSPEQAKGRTADKKSDIWAFGCVLFEMLAGTRAFEGDDVSETMAAVIRGEPDWSRLPSVTPAYVRTLLRRCLQKDTRKRLPDIGLVRLELDDDEPRAAPVVEVVARRTPWWKWAMPAVGAAVLAAATTGVAVWRGKPAPAAPIVRYLVFSPVDLTPTVRNRRAITVAPDGTVVFAANQQLYRRRLGEFEATPIPGSQHGAVVVNPAFSPDGQQLVFVSGADRTIKKIGVNGGTAVTVVKLPSGLPFGLSWDTADTILFAPGVPGGDIMRVSATSGKAEPVVAIEPGEIAYGPQMLPGNQGVLFTLAAASGSDSWRQARIVIQPLPSGDRHIVLEDAADGRYVPTGHIVYAVEGSLFAIPFDVSQFKPSGAASLVLQGVARSPLLPGTPVAHFAFSSNGTLAYLPGPVSPSSGGSGLFVVDRSGTQKEIKVGAAAYEAPRVSPNGGRVAVSTADGVIYIYDVTAGIMRKLTLNGHNRYPVWVSEERIAFQSDREGTPGIFWQRADGRDTATRLTTADAGTQHIPESWSTRDNLLSYSLIDQKSGAALWTYSITEMKSAPVKTIRSARPLNSEFSPDGNFVAYTTRGDEGVAVRVEPFPPTGEVHEVSQNDGGHHPLWSRLGTELSYFPSANAPVVVPVSTKGAFTAADRPAPHPSRLPVNVGPDSPRNHDVFPDGSFIAVLPRQLESSGAPAAIEIRVVLNWFEDLKRLTTPRR